MAKESFGDDCAAQKGVAEIRKLSGIVQEALSQIESLLDTLFESAKDSILLMDGLRFVDCNPTTLRMFGCQTKNDILGKTVLSISPSLQPGGVSSAQEGERLVALAMSGEPQDFEWRHRRFDGTEFDVEVSLNRTLVGGAAFLVAVVRDITRRKQAEAAVIQEKQFSERLIESLPGIFYLYDSNLCLRRWNKNQETGMGYTAGELLGRAIGDWQATEEHRQRVIEAAHRVLQQGGETEVLETELRYKDGSIVPYLITGTRIDSPEGPMLTGVGLNISARVQAQKALAASEHKYREVFNATNDAFFIHDQWGRILEVNERACVMFGFDVKQALRLSIGEVSSGEPPYSQREALEKVRLAISKGPQVFDWQSKTVAGEFFWSEVALRAFWIEGEVRVIASVRDITDRKLAALERERREAQAKFLAESSELLASSLDYTTTLKSVVRLAVQSVADLCLVLLLEHGRIYIAEIEHSDAEKHDIVERLRYEYHPRPDLPISVGHVIQTRKSELIPEVTDEALREHACDDEHLTLVRLLNPKSAMLTPLILGDDLLGVMIFLASDGRRYDADDLTFAEEIARHAAIAIHNARLYTDAQRAIRARDEVLRMVSHDLRNPVSNIQMSAHLLAKTSLPDEDRQGVLQMIDRASRRMTRLIDDLLTAGRIQEGRETSLNVDRIDPAAIFDHVCAAVRPQAQAKAIDLRCNKPAITTAVKADGDRIFQVLINLLDNAIKFTPKGGSVTLSCEERDGDVQFAVEDTGRGINPKDLQKMFDPFWQAKPGADFGSGLGLSIAKGIVEQHKGRIWADSTPGAGTTVFFTIPQGDVDQEPLKPKAA
jgi:PAS domain S-box-containing protein